MILYSWIQKEFLTEGDNAITESTHFTLFWRNNALVERLQNLLPDVKCIY